ncbi:tRNA pseudouridine(55) synthase TruB, partial [Salmonella enterica subsp. enterica serovar Enteritidis]
IVQIPPMYSAVKVKGKKLYEYARNNDYVERPSRIVHVVSFNRTSELFYDERDATVSFSFKVNCGKGTYVRTLAVDLEEKLGYPSHMSNLTRTKSAGLKKEDALTLGEME